MEDKYYVPELEEFHVGFEYQVKMYNPEKSEPEEWVKAIWDKFSSFSDCMCVISDGDKIIDIHTNDSFRVKHLDRQDIEECGWKQIEYDSFALGDFILEFNPEHYTYIYLKIYTKDVRFKGTIKNISELRRIMKQLNIE